MIKTEIKNDITVLCLIFLNNKCLISARLIQIHVNGKKSVQCKTQTADPKNSSPQSVCSLQFTLPQRVHHGISMGFPQCFLCARSRGYAGTSQKKQWTYLEL